MGRCHLLLPAAGFAVLCASAVAAPAFDVDRLSFRVTGPSPFAADCNGVPQTGTLYPNAEVEPFVGANPRNPLNLVGTWQQDRWSDGGAQGLGTAFSFDGGVHWQRRFPPFTRCAGGNASNGGDYERGSDPWVSFSPNGTVHVMVLTLNNTPAPGAPTTAMLAARSTDGGRTWGRINTLVADTAELFNDKNSITADPTDSRFVYAVWDRLDFVSPVSSGPTLLARSTDNGRTWEAPSIIYEPGVNGQTIGNRIEVLPDGTLINLFTDIDFLTGGLTLRAIRSTDKGVTWSAPIKVADELPLGTADPETGAPIRDGAILPQFVVSRSGKISVVWQDARFSGFLRDGIAYAESTDGGLTWSEPVQINSDPLVQAFVPTIHARRDGSIGVTYYDLRNNTADPATLPTDLWLTRSRDGLTWRESRVTRTFDLATAPVARGLFLGDYQGLTSIGPIFIPFFAKTTGDPGNANEVFSHLALDSILAGAARGTASIERQVAEEEATLPALAVQGTGRALGPVPAAVREAGMNAAQRVLRARVPDWDARRAQRSAAPR